MTTSKSERHHWWPACLSERWKGSDGCVGWLTPEDELRRAPPKNFGVIGNGNHIRLGRGVDRNTPFDQSFEAVLEAHGGFWVADCDLPNRKRTVRDALPGKLRDPAQIEWVLHDSEVFAIAHEPDHMNRHDALLAYVGDHSYAGDDAEGALKRALAITFVLDAWAEGHVEGLPAAVAYAHCLVPRWRRAALKWLKPHRGVYLPQYFRDRPELTVLTRETRKVVTGLPRWLGHSDEGAQRPSDAAWSRSLS